MQADLGPDHAGPHHHATLVGETRQRCEQQPHDVQADLSTGTGLRVQQQRCQREDEGQGIGKGAGPQDGVVSEGEQGKEACAEKRRFPGAPGIAGGQKPDQAATQRVTDEIEQMQHPRLETARKHQQAAPQAEVQRPVIPVGTDGAPELRKACGFDPWYLQEIVGPERQLQGWIVEEQRQCDGDCCSCQQYDTCGLADHCCAHSA